MTVGPVCPISGIISTMLGKPESAARFPEGQMECGWVGTYQAGAGVAMIVHLFKLIHPHFSCTDTVGQSLVASVRSLLGEDVANVGTGVCFQSATALPDLHTEQRRG
jgi:hypothetical protein